MQQPELGYDELKHWQHCIAVMYKPEYEHLHRIYSSIEGWAKLSYKHREIRVTYKQSVEQIEREIKKLLNLPL